MQLKAIALSFFVLIFIFCSCNTKDMPGNVASDSDIAVTAEPENAAPRKLPAPPGEQGPILIRLADNFPTQIFASAASESHIAIALQSDVRDISLCTETELPICFQGMGVVAQRRNPNQPKAVKLYESDTQSGNRIDDVATDGKNFVFALREGKYVGDTPVAKLVIVDENAAIARDIVLSAPDIHISRISLNTLNDGRLLVCKAYERVPGPPGLICEKLDISTGKTSPAATIQTQSPIRNFDISIHDEHILAAWIESGYAYAAFLDTPNDKLELGLATAVTPRIAAGLDDFAVIWQSDDAQTHVDKIPVSGAIKSIQRHSMLLSGLDYRSIGGIVAVSEGYLFAFRHQNTQQMALISTDFKTWNLLNNSNSWRMLSDYASLDIQEAHSGKILWQTAESIVGIQ